MCIVITVAMVMLLRDFGPFGIIFVNVCVVITVAMVIPLRDFLALLDNIYDYVCSLLWNFQSFLTGNLLS
jgi:uncharacterized YccA/Bax inhibitor family protein